MEHSESIAKLATALAKAQGVMTGAAKDSANPFFKSKYADLESVWTACRKPLSDNGLSVIQGANADDSGVMVTTTLAHESGEWIKSTLRMIPKDSGPQAVGSCISYARRYALASMVGIYQSDDDAESATARGKNDPRGEDYKQQDMKKAQEYADRFRSQLEAGSDEGLFQLHTECNALPDFYIAVSTKLSPAERRTIKDAIHRVQAAQRGNGVRP